jgi:hypothetical protein
MTSFQKRTHFGNVYIEYRNESCAIFFGSFTWEDRHRLQPAVEAKHL